MLIIHVIHCVFLFQLFFWFSLVFYSRVIKTLKIDFICVPIKSFAVSYKQWTLPIGQHLIMKCNRKDRHFYSVTYELMHSIFWKGINSPSEILCKLEKKLPTNRKGENANSFKSICEVKGFILLNLIQRTL